MSSLPQQTRFGINIVSSTPSSFSKIVPHKIAQLVLFVALLFMKFTTSAAAPLSVSSTPAAVDRSIVLFEDGGFKGIRSRLYVGPSTCINLVGKLNDFFSSVDPMGGCYYLCEHQNCRGRCERIIQREPHLMALNDRVSSLRLCDDTDSKLSTNVSSSGRQGTTHERIESGSMTNSNGFPFVFLRRLQRLRRSVNLKPDEVKREASPIVPSLVYDNLQKWRTHHDEESQQAIVEDFRSRLRRNENIFRTDAQSSPSTNESNLPPTKQRSSGNNSTSEDGRNISRNTGLIHKTERRGSYQRLVRIRRPRQRRKWIK